MSVLRSLISASLIVSPFILLALLTVPLIDKRYAPGGRCRIWLMLMAALCLPLVSVMPKPAFQIELPVAVISEPVVYTLEKPVADMPQDKAPAGAYLPDASTESEPGNPTVLKGKTDSFTSNEPDSKKFSTFLEAVKAHLPTLLFTLWLLGALALLSLRLGSYLMLRRSVRRWSTDVADEHILKAFEDARTSLGARGRPGLMSCKKLTSPMLMGYFKPLVLLPTMDYIQDELALLLRHELAHYKRRDLWFKLALVAVTSVYWFNPLIHWMAAQAGKDLEAACDALTVNGGDMPLRKRYSEIILSAAVHPQLRPHPMTTHFFGGKHMLKKRFSNILGAAKKKGTALFFVTGTVILVVALMVGFNFARAETPPVSTPPSFSDENENLTDEVFDVYDLEAYTEKMQEYVNDWNAYMAQMERQIAWMEELYRLYQSKDQEAYEAKLKEYTEWMEESFETINWSAYASQSGDMFITLPPEGTWGSFDWDEYAAQWEDYATQMEEYWSQLSYGIVTLPPEGDWGFIDWDAHAAQMEEYELQMEDFQRQMEEMVNSMEEGFSTIDWDSAGNAKAYTLDELSELVYNQSKPMECRFDNVTSLKLLGLTSEHVKVTRGGDMMTIRYPEWYEGEYVFLSENDGKTVSMNKETNRYLKQGNGFSGGWLTEVLRHKGIQAEIVIEIVIPESMPLDSLHISNVSGKVDITDCTLGKLSISSVSSPVAVTGGQINTLNLSDVDGRSDIQSCAFDSLNASTVSGIIDVQLTGKASDYDIAFNNMSGSLKVNGTAVKSARNKSADKKIEFSGVSGSLSVSDVR